MLNVNFFSHHFHPIVLLDSYTFDSSISESGNDIANPIGTRFLSKDISDLSNTATFGCKGYINKMPFSFSLTSKFSLYFKPFSKAGSISINSLTVAYYSSNIYDMIIVTSFCFHSP